MSKRRGGYRKVATEKISEINTILQSANVIDCDNLLLEVHALEEVLLKLEEFDDSIQDSISDDDEMFADLQESLRRKKLIKASLFKAQKILNSASTTALSSVNSNAQPLSVKLPQIKFPFFDGDPMNWPMFWDGFEAAIDQRMDMMGSQKLTYLRGQLENDAAKLIQGFPTTNDNYVVALKLLKDTYGKPEKIINAHLQFLIDIKQCSDNLKDLCRFRSEYECHIRALQSLRPDIDKESVVITTILLRKIHHKIRDNMNRSMNLELWTLEDFSVGLNKEIQYMQVASIEKSDVVPKEDDSWVNRKEESRSHFHKSKQLGNYATPSAPSYKNKRREIRCKFCQEEHFCNACPNYRSRRERLNQVNFLKLCQNCLNDHAGSCTTKFSCYNCQQRHHTSLCPNVVNLEERNSDNVYNSFAPATVAWQDARSNSIALPTALIDVKYLDTTFKIRCLFDQCAQQTMFLESVAKSMNLPISRYRNLTIDGFGSRGRTLKYGCVDLTLSDSLGRIYEIEAVLVKNLPERVTVPGIDVAIEYLKTCGLFMAESCLVSDELTNISMLVGADNYYKFVVDQFKFKDYNLLSSHFGHMLSGPLPSKVQRIEASDIVQTMICVCGEEGGRADDDLQKLWTLDSIGISQEKDLEKNDILKNFEETIEFKNGVYIARLPWKKNHPLLMENYGMARAMLKSSLEKLRRKPIMLEHYNDVIRDQLKRGFIEKLNYKEIKSMDHIRHYLPHHAVEKDSATTPLRVVFNCSAGRVSLNDCLYSGPSLNSDTIHILLRFRLKRFVCLSDIAKAFLMISLHDEDRDVTRFIWPSNPFEEDGNIDVYRFKVILFGATCSQFILNATIRYHLKMNDSKVAKQILRNIYVDNLFYSSDFEDELPKFYEKSKELLARANLHLREWISNSVKTRNLFESNEDAAKKKCQSVSVLGLKWSNESDMLSIKQKTINEFEGKVNKRNVLRFSAKFFDPLGYLSPVLIRAKMFMQHLWKQKSDWDSVLSLEDEQAWKKIMKELCESTSFFVPRVAVSERDVVLHAFSDASKRAYGAALYLSDRNSSNLILAKARVAPIRTLTIPQLELTAATVSARLVNEVRKAYSEELNIKEVHMWTDSEIALHWIFQKDNNKKPYIQARVDEIHKLVPDGIWHYVPTKENPSDLCTRGLDAKTFLSNNLWVYGPSWIMKNGILLPWSPTTGNEGTVCMVESSLEEDSSGFDNVRYSQYDKMLRIFALVMSFISKIKKIRASENKKEDIRKQKLNLNYDSIEISTAMVTAAEDFIIKDIQNREFRSELVAIETKQLTNLCKQLSLFVSSGFLHCRGRIEYADVPDQVKYPIILPSKHHVTRLIIRKIHVDRFHGGVNDVVTAVRQKYWIPCIRQRTKTCLRECITCKRLHGSPYRVPEIPSLPPTRTMDARPFQIVGVDLSGAYLTKEKKEIAKVYICLFTCAVTRAMHLELVEDVSAESFLRAFRRFVGRRGCPQVIYSDNATNFTASSKYLKELFDHLTVKQYLLTQRCEWRFIPKRAPWFGGFWERLIGLTKSTLKKVLGRSMIQTDELRTLLIEVESILNNRPMTYEGGNLDDVPAISPIQLIYGYRIDIPILQPVVENDEDFTLRETFSKRQKRSAVLIDHFNQRWKAEYLTSLRQNKVSKCKGSLTPVVGDVVIIHDETPRTVWKLGLIEELVAGRDGNVRSAILKTNNRTTSRPIAKLYPLEIRATDFIDKEQVETEKKNDDGAVNETSIPKPKRRAAIGCTKKIQDCINRELV